MLALCARYQPRAVGSAANSIQSPIAGEDGGPPRPSRRAAISQPSRRSRSLTARHQRLPGTSASSEARTPRWICHLMKESAARRNRRWRADPSVGSSYVRAHSANRAMRIVAHLLDQRCCAVRSARRVEHAASIPSKPLGRQLTRPPIPGGAQKDRRTSRKTIVSRDSFCRPSVCDPRKLRPCNPPVSSSRQPASPSRKNRPLPGEARRSLRPAPHRDQPAGAFQALPAARDDRDPRPWLKLATPGELLEGIS